MPFDTMDSPSNFTGRFAEAGRRKNVYETTGDQLAREDERRVRSASVQSLLRRLDPFGDSDRLEGIGKKNDEMYDLEYRTPVRNRLGREELLRDAEGEQSRYFAQEPMREDKEAASLRGLKARYTDPALIKAEADIRREMSRGGTQREVAGINAGSRERTAATNQFGDVTGAQALAGDRAAAASGRGELQGRMGQPAQRPALMSRIAAMAERQGVTLEEALEWAEANGYTVVDDAAPAR